MYFKLKNINNSTHNFHGGIGLDLITDKGLNLMTKFTLDQSNGNNDTEQRPRGCNHAGQG